MNISRYYSYSRFFSSIVGFYFLKFFKYANSFFSCFLFYSSLSYFSSSTITMDKYFFYCSYFLWGEFFLFFFKAAISLTVRLHKSSSEISFSSSTSVPLFSNFCVYYFFFNLRYYSRTPTIVEYLFKFSAAFVFAAHNSIFVSSPSF